MEAYTRGEGVHHTRLTSRNMETVKLTGSFYGADHPGSCLRREPMKDTKTWLEWLEMWCWYTGSFTRKKISEIWARTLKNVRQPCPRPKKLKEYRIKGCEISGFPGGAHMAWSASGNWSVIWINTIMCTNSENAFFASPWITLRCPT